MSKEELKDLEESHFQLERYIKCLKTYLDREEGNRISLEIQIKQKKKEIEDSE